MPQPLAIRLWENGKLLSWCSACLKQADFQAQIWAVSLERKTYVALDEPGTVNRERVLSLFNEHGERLAITGNPC